DGVADRRLVALLTTRVADLPGALCRAAVPGWKGRVVGADRQETGLDEVERARRAAGYRCGRARRTRCRRREEERDESGEGRKGDEGLAHGSDHSSVTGTRRGGEATTVYGG